MDTNKAYRRRSYNPHKSIATTKPKVRIRLYNVQSLSLTKHCTLKCDTQLPKADNDILPFRLRCTNAGIL
jgi:hypothetical protein